MSLEEIELYKIMSRAYLRTGNKNINYFIHRLSICLYHKTPLIWNRLNIPRRIGKTTYISKLAQQYSKTEKVAVITISSPCANMIRTIVRDETLDVIVENAISQKDYIDISLRGYDKILLDEVSYDYYSKLLKNCRFNNTEIIGIVAK